MSIESCSYSTDDSSDEYVITDEDRKELKDLVEKHGDINIFKDIVWNVSDEPSKARKIKAELMAENEFKYRFAAAMIILSESVSFATVHLQDNAGQPLNIFDDNLDIPIRIFGNNIKITYRTAYPGFSYTKTPTDDEDFDRKYVFDDGKDVTIEYIANGEFFTYYEILTHIYEFYQENKHILSKFEKKELEFTMLSCRNWPPIDTPNYVVHMKLKN